MNLPHAQHTCLSMQRIGSQGYNNFFAARGSAHENILRNDSQSDDSRVALCPCQVRLGVAEAPRLCAVWLAPLALAAGAVLVADAFIAAALCTFPTCTRASVWTACPALSHRSVTAVLSLAWR